MRNRWIIVAMVVIAIGAIYVALKDSRPADAQEGVVEYTVVPGDTCWDIAQRFGNDGSMFDVVVYYQNQSEIESNVRQYGLESSDFCHWIHPGLKLFISPNGHPPMVAGKGYDDGPGYVPNGQNNGGTFVFAPVNINVDRGNEFDDEWPFWVLVGLLAFLALLLVGAFVTMSERYGYGHHHHDVPTPPPPPTPPTPTAPTIYLVLLPFGVDISVGLVEEEVEPDTGEEKVEPEPPVAEPPSH